MKSLWIISYDIADSKRLRKVAKFLEGYGIRIQKSVFRLKVTDRDIQKVKWEISKKIMDEDSVFYFRFCNNCAKHVHKENPKHFSIEKEPTYLII